jgi:hypothetical protein
MLIYADEAKSRADDLPVMTNHLILSQISDIHLK